jgi:4-hydroxy-3-polyprenylbenzoate decarboxylase
MSRGARTIVVGITGASGSVYAHRLLTVIGGMKRAGGDLEIACVVSPTAREVWALEIGGAPEDLGVPVHAAYNAPFASGSSAWDAMVIVPCSMGTAGRIANGVSDSLLVRAADVMIKERRTLIVVPREAPLSAIHLENLLALSRAGAVVLPACPSFYGKPATVQDAVDTVVARVIDHLGIEHSIGPRWGAAR